MAIAIPSYRGIVPLDFCRELVHTCSNLLLNRVSNCILTERENSIIANARNRLVHSFLKDTKMQKLVFLDDDIIFTWADFERLLGWSTHYNIVCGAYPTRQFPIKYFINFDEKDPQFSKHGLLSIRGTGLGFAVIDRGVFERLSPPEYKVQGEMIKAYFDTETRNGKLFGEDMWFFEQCRKNGEEVWLDPLINLGHFGNHTYEGRFDEYLGNLLRTQNG